MLCVFELLYLCYWIHSCNPIKTFEKKKPCSSYEVKDATSVSCYLYNRLHILQFAKYTNKRAQRALGRSPEEKVTGHSGAIYRGPLMLSTKYW